MSPPPAKSKSTRPIICIFHINGRVDPQRETPNSDLMASRDTILSSFWGPGGPRILLRNLSKNLCTKHVLYRSKWS